MQHLFYQYQVPHTFQLVALFPVSVPVFCLRNLLNSITKNLRPVLTHCPLLSFTNGNTALEMVSFVISIGHTFNCFALFSCSFSCLHTFPSIPQSWKIYDFSYKFPLLHQQRSSVSKGAVISHLLDMYWCLPVLTDRSEVSESWTHHKWRLTMMVK